MRTKSHIDCSIIDHLTAQQRVYQQQAHKQSQEQAKEHILEQTQEQTQEQVEPTHTRNGQPSTKLPPTSESSRPSSSAPPPIPQPTHHKGTVRVDTSRPPPPLPPLGFISRHEQQQEQIQLHSAEGTQVVTLQQLHEEKSKQTPPSFLDFDVR